jgi:peptide/nickel transport system permease protein
LKRRGSRSFVRGARIGKDRAVLSRVARLIPTLFVVTFLSFLLINLLPGDPARQIVGMQYATPENVERVRNELGLDDPIHVRYAHWLGNLVQGDLGVSYRNSQPVWESILERLPATVELLVLAQLVAIGGALVIAPLAALRPGSRFDRATTLGISGALSLPPFALGLVLIFTFAVRWNLFPATGFVHLSDSISGNLRSMVLPTVTLALVPLAVYVQVLRAEMTTVLQEDFVTLARGRGLPTGYVMLRHVLRPSSLPLVTLVGINVGGLIGGAVLIEVIFSLPGLGRLAVDAIYNQDYILVQGFVVFITVSYVLINFAVDLLYSLLDPRIGTQPR